MTVASGIRVLQAGRPASKTSSSSLAKKPVQGYGHIGGRVMGVDHRYPSALPQPGHAPALRPGGPGRPNPRRPRVLLHARRGRGGRRRRLRAPAAFRSPRS
ncbi:MAG: hypothetical protein MZV70_20315 [Desulfobacterales bacterium]|nr:hypothetical protein [Desulfobacterales bacterium]